MNIRRYTIRCLLRLLCARYCAASVYDARSCLIFAYATYDAASAAALMIARRAMPRCCRFAATCALLFADEFIAIQERRYADIMLLLRCQRRLHHHAHHQHHSHRPPDYHDAHFAMTMLIRRCLRLFRYMPPRFSRCYHYHDFRRACHDAAASRRIRLFTPPPLRYADAA